MYKTETRPFEDVVRATSEENELAAEKRAILENLESIKKEFSDLIREFGRE